MSHAARWQILWTCAVRVLVPALGLLAATDTAATQSRKTVWDGVYAKAQARRGLQTYTSVCVYCHGPDLEGDETGPALKGSSFMAQWRDQTVFKLLVKIVETMPENNPGSLSPQAAIDVLSFLLEANQIPAGSTDLPTDPAALEEIFVTERTTK